MAVGVSGFCEGGALLCFGSVETIHRYDACQMIGVMVGGVYVVQPACSWQDFQVMIDGVRWFAETGLVTSIAPDLAFVGLDSGRLAGLACWAVGRFWAWQVGSSPSRLFYSPLVVDAISRRSLSQACRKFGGYAICPSAWG
jgi:hypothetical protein